MAFIKWILVGCIFLGASLETAIAQENIGRDGLGQTIQINVDLTGFTGQPSWLINIHDVDNNQSLPHMFDITKNNHYWLIFTYGRNYLITASEMQIVKFSEHYDDYRLYRLNDFCHLESNGHIARGESITVWLTGELTPSMDKIHCQISRFNDPNFNVTRTEMNN